MPVNAELSDLQAATSPTGGELIYIVQGGNSRKLALGAVGAKILDDTGFTGALTSIGVTALGRSILDDTGQTKVRATIGLGSSAVVDTGTFLSDSGAFLSDTIITTLGRNILDDTGQTTAQTTLGAGASGRTIFAAATAATVRDHLEVGPLISVDNYGADPANTSAANETAFNLAETDAVADSGAPIYVPAGVFKLSTPLNRGYTARYYGPGVLQFDNAEWLRPGGSSGSVSVNENYTLFYEHDDTGGVSVQFNGVPQAITWTGNFTVNAPGSLGTDAVRINIVNGKKRLPMVPDMGRSFNTIDGQAPALAPSQPDAVTQVVGYNNTFLGTQTPVALTTGINNTFAGSRAGRSLQTGNNNTGFGFQSLYRVTGDHNTAVGSIAGEWMTTGTNNTLIGSLAGAKVRTGIYNTAVGYEAFGENETGTYNVAVGYRALGNPPESLGTPDESVAVGVFAGDFTYGDKNVWIGYRAGNGDTGTSDGFENVAVGYFAMRNHQGADLNVAVGVSALNALSSGQQNVAIGHSALAAVTTVGAQVAVGYQALTANTTGTENVAVGTSALLTNTTASSNTAVGVGALQLSNSAQNVAVGTRAGTALTSATGLTAIGFEAGRFTDTGDFNTFIGWRAGRSTTDGDENTVIGADALFYNTTGIQNTALGRLALRLDQAAANQTTYNNTTGVGYDARVSGSNQVQLGNSATTTYAYGAVQDRSDARDKADIRDTALGLDFIMSLRPVDFRWDMREDYIEVTEDGEVIRHEKDGSRKRKRFHHGFIAQEIAGIGFEFGGLQDHSVNGGNDVMSIGYGEFFGPLVKALQQVAGEVEKMKAEIADLKAHLPNRD